MEKIKGRLFSTVQNRNEAPMKGFTGKEFFRQEI